MTPLLAARRSRLSADRSEAVVCSASPVSRAARNAFTAVLVLLWMLRLRALRFLVCRARFFADLC